jgi:hypothetical protein
MIYLFLSKRQVQFHSRMLFLGAAFMLDAILFYVLPICMPRAQTRGQLRSGFDLMRQRCRILRPKVLKLGSNNKRGNR